MKIVWTIRAHIVQYEIGTCVLQRFSSIYSKFISFIIKIFTFCQRFKYWSEKFQKEFINILLFFFFNLNSLISIQLTGYSVNVKKKAFTILKLKQLNSGACVWSTEKNENFYSSRVLKLCALCTVTYHAIPNQILSYFYAFSIPIEVFFFS